MQGGALHLSPDRAPRYQNHDVNLARRCQWQSRQSYRQQKFPRVPQKGKSVILWDFSNRKISRISSLFLNICHFSIDIQFVFVCCAIVNDQFSH